MKLVKTFFKKITIENHRTLVDISESALYANEGYNASKTKEIK